MARLMSEVYGGVMMNRLLRNGLAAALLLLLAGCFQVELGGPVPGATIVITELRTGESVQSGLTSLDEPTFVMQNSQKKWDSFNDLTRMVILGNFFLGTPHFSPNQLYLVTVSGGADMDANSDLVEDENYTPVAGSWHTIMKGHRLIKGGFMISVVTEALYQSVKKDIARLDDSVIMTRLNRNTRTILNDVNEDGLVNYNDALGWTVLAHKGNYLLNFAAIENLAAAIARGDSESQRSDLADAVFEDRPENPEQFFADNISMPIIQSKCINCHVRGGIADARGARIIYVTNSNSDHIAINHRALVSFSNLSTFNSRDFSDYVTSKASGRISHFGGVQLNPGSQDLRNLETYLNMIE